MNVNVDFLDPNTFSEGAPYAAYSALRAEAPVSWHHSAAGGHGYWIVTRHADIQEVLINATDFSSALGGSALRQLSEFELNASRQMLNAMDPPNHTRHRKLVTRPFAARAVERLKPRVRDLTASLIDRVCGRDVCDAVDDLAAELPMQVILEVLGVPAADRGRLYEISTAIMHVDDPEMGGSLEVVQKGVMELIGYFIKLAYEKRASPQDDLMTLLAQSEVDGERLTDEELGLFFVPLLIAGNETTRSLIASGIQLMAERTELTRELRANRALLPGAIEEMLRYVSPLCHLRRTASRDLEFRGQQLHRGDMVVLALASANRDEAVFSNPNEFDIKRTTNPHISFGVGPHLCFGAALTRIEASLFFELFLDRFSAVEAVGPSKRIRSNFMNSLKSLPVRLVPATETQPLS
ncbi:cytochrome P450 [Sorangium sp. So ce1151]|uniref:cytochrome P450 n=1 Tax=Sorangium sp. So ce1151 TaxID=3133332 RepID=UPI003F5F6432